MDSQSIFDSVGRVSQVLSLPFFYAIIYGFLKEFLGFKHKPKVFVFTALIFEILNCFIVKSPSLPLEIIIDNLFWLVIICSLCKGNFIVKLYTNSMQAAIIILTAITFIGFDYKLCPLLINNLNMAYKGHIFLLFLVNMLREFISLAVLYIFLKNVCRFLSFKERTVNFYQGIYLILPSLASYSMAVLFYMVQQIRIDGRDYFLMSIFPNMYYVVPLVSLGLLISLLIAAYTFKKMLEGEEMQQTNLLMQQQLKQQLNHSKSIEGLYIGIRSVTHDMNNHLICLSSLLQENNIEEIKKYIDNLRDTVTKLSFEIKTGNTIADVVLNDKYNLAKAQGIKFKYDFMLPTETLLEPMDLCIILSNVLDNSIEACMRMNDLAIPKEIYIKSYLNDRYLIIEVSNSTFSKLQYADNKIMSQKGDSINHGIGLSNVVAAVKKYNGVVDIIDGKNMFTINLMLKIK